jgi:hypothetical protein
LSQRTHARTTGAASRRRPEPAAASDQAAEHPSAPGVPFDPETLARTLRAVAAELERDPELARRVAQAVHAAEPGAPSPATPASDTPPEPRAAARRPFRPRLVTGASPDLGSGIPDPFALHAERGEVGLREVLAELRLGTLRAMVREYGLDPKGSLARQNDAEKLRMAILAAVRRR